MADKKISALTAATTPLAGTEVLPIVQSASTVKVAVNDMLGVTSWTSPAVNSEGNMFLRATDTLGTGVGTQIGLGGKYNASSYFPFAAVAGRKENATNNNVAGYLAFLTTTSGGTLTERARFNSTGNLAFSTAGNGIDFSANTHAAGMTSELLNWYEEGAWTPSVGGDATYTTQEGYYVRVGDLVYVQCQLLLNVLGTGSTTTISGLPFQAFNPSNSSRGTGSVWYCGNLATNVTSIVPGVTPAGQTITFGGFTAAGASMSVPLTVFQNGTRVDFAMTYRAN
jgi:hypothetical protein